MRVHLQIGLDTRKIALRRMYLYFARRTVSMRLSLSIPLYFAFNLLVEGP